MKKTLLSILGVAATMASVAQTPSPSWTLEQNTNFPLTSFGTKFLDVVDNNVIWTIGYHGVAGETSKNYNWCSRSIDGGANFTSAPIFSSAVTPGIGDTNTYVIANLEGLDANTAWVSAYTKAGGGSKGAIFQTTDGGANWTKMGPAAMYANASSFCNVVSFCNSQVGITSGDPNSSTANEHEIWRTTDGGITWNLVPAANIPNPSTGEYGLVNVYEKQGPNTFWFGTNKGRIYRSTDGGLNWNVSTVTAASIAATTSINDIAFSSATNGVCYAFTGTTPNFTFTMYNTNDGGATWTLIPTPDPNVGRNDICAVPGANLLASCGSATNNSLLSYSNDNGITWNDWGSTGIQYLTIDFASPSAGWSGSFSDAANSSTGGIYKFTDAALTPNAFAGFIPEKTFGCAPTTATVSNFSTGTPAPSFAWSVSPAATISNSTAATPSFTFTNAGNYTITLTATSGTSTSTDTRIVYAANCTGLVDNNSVLASVNVYPNPTKNIVNVEVSNTESYNLTLVDVLGKVVLTGKGENNSTIALDLSNQIKGVYFLVIESNGNKTTKKIILE